jgi:hypothetical protein
MDTSAYNSGHAISDYQSDQLYHGLKSLPDITVHQFPHPWHMHKSAPSEQLKLIWGKGMTLYGLLDNEDYKNDDVNEVLFDSDLIIIPLHSSMVERQNKYFDFIKDVKEIYGKKVIAVDGWDQPYYNEDIAKLVPYFKRELSDDRTSALPIFFGIPEEKFVGDIDKNEERRKWDFSPIIPANFSWRTQHTEGKYHIYDNEKDYYEHYQQSYVGLNSRKGGWQTLRLLEQIANNCLPFFTDIERMPKNTWHNLNRELLIEVKRLKGIKLNSTYDYNPEIDTYFGDARQIKPGLAGWIEWDKFDLNQYYNLLKSIKDYHRQYLTTKALAIYVLERSL